MTKPNTKLSERMREDARLERLYRPEEPESGVYTKAEALEKYADEVAALEAERDALIHDMERQMDSLNKEAAARIEAEDERDALRRKLEEALAEPTLDEYNAAVPCGPCDAVMDFIASRRARLTGAATASPRTTEQSAT